MFQKGDLCKHFKGESLIQKNIYEILEVGVKYTGEAEGIEGTLVVYRNIFQEDKIFARELWDMTAEIAKEKQEQFHQTYRVEKLTKEEQELVKSEAFRREKMEYIKSKS